MRKKLTYEYVNQFFEKQGCKLLEEKYINNRSKMKYICVCGNITEIIFNNFRRGQRCKKCGTTKTIQKQKYSFEKIKQYFKDQNCELLETLYINRHTKMKYRCSCGNIGKITFGHFKHGHRCQKCGNVEKYKIKDVKQYFKNNNCKLLEKEYINNKTEMNYICKCGNFDKISFSSFKKGQKCQKCSKKKKYTFFSVQKYFEDNNCELLETKFVNFSTKMKYKCSCGNITEITFANFKKGERCKKCGIKKISKENNINWIKDRQVVKDNKAFRNKCHTMLNNFYKQVNQKKINKSSILLGYTIQELKDYIYKHPNWSKIDKNNWHLDHIFPIKSFLDYNIKDLKLINCLDNLQPLNKQENLSKHSKYNKNKFEDWLRGKGYQLSLKPINKKEEVKVKNNEIYK